MKVHEELPTPIRGGQPGLYVETLRAAQTEYKGKWVEVVTAGNVTGYRGSFSRSFERGGAYAEVDVPNFEWATRTHIDGNMTLYARYPA